MVAPQLLLGACGNISSSEQSSVHSAASFKEGSAFFMSNIYYMADRCLFTKYVDPLFFSVRGESKLSQGRDLNH